MRKIFVYALLVFLFGTLASAQIPTSGNVFFGYSYYNTNLSPIDRANTNGWQATLEGKFLPFIGFVADIDAHYGSQNFVGACTGVPGPCGTFNSGLTEHNYLFGPRASVSVGPVRPFAEFEIGLGHAKLDAGPSDSSLAYALGGGVDYKLLRILGWRLQGDYIRTKLFDQHQGNVRISTGLVLRF